MIQESSSAQSLALPNERAARDAEPPSGVAASRNLRIIGPGKPNVMRDRAMAPFLPDFKYESYQDIRRNLTWYTIVPLVAFELLIYHWGFPSAVRRAVDAWFASLPTQGPWKEYLSGIVLSAIAAFALVEVIKVHDRFYDKYFVRWRRRYDIDFIMPRLLRGFWHRLTPTFEERLRTDLPTVMEELYYRYVGDRDTQIRRNLVVRFYERMTIYWMTQINEIIIALTFLVVLIIRSFAPVDLADRARLLDLTLALVLMFALNRVWVRTARSGVQAATNAEIEDLVAKHASDLDNRLRALCRRYSLPYASDA